jgi:2-polyprenyl-3-methyl-5-hydroxy-6-metoxy-1,4-benzoquinol methylase
LTERETKNIESDEIAFFERIYEEGMYHPVGFRLRMARELKSLLKTAGDVKLERVLSLGCGDGQFELMLAPHVGHITALDISPPAIEIAKRNAERAGVTNVDYQCLPLSELSWDTQFDAVLCIAFLHHVPIPDLPSLLEEAYAHTKPGGFFYSQDPNKDGILRKVGRIVLRDNYDKYHSPDERELVPGEFKQQLKDAGFKKVKIGYIDVTLIPSYFVMTSGPSAPFYAARAVDWVWVKTPLAPLASGFYAYGKKKAEAPPAAPAS